MNFSDYFAPVEAVLFASGDAVPESLIAKAVETDLKTTRKIMDEMIKWYDEGGRGIRLIRINDSYQLCTRKEYYENLIRVEINAAKPKLSPVVIETLSIIAYRQPVTRVEIEKIRGVKSDHSISKLLEYGLIEEVGRLEMPGRPVLFGTSEEFLRVFGLSKTDELPQISEELMDEIKRELNEEEGESSEQENIEENQNILL
ncbi:MAG: SMC-Scp complex subunit ScpB [Lachnospiraceae bacterium]|jgi:segregation and condensation protein B